MEQQLNLIKTYKHVLKAIFKDENKYETEIYKIIEKDWNKGTHDKDEEAIKILKIILIKIK